MFGLMKAKTCGLTDQEKLQRRLHYCGTCKTVGSLYGQKARLLLDHDTVFLAEILTALGDEDFDLWQPALQSFNCLNLPKSEMPVALEFAATANVVLADFKLQDQITDENKLRWRLATKTFSKAFKKAHRKLAQWQFPLADLRTILLEQNELEIQISGQSPDHLLDSLSAPTATATALFFEHGAKVIGCETAQEKMFGLGAAFGKLIYLLDAFEDYERDFRASQFNAFRAAFELKEDKLFGFARRQAVEKIRFEQNKIAQKLNELPIETELKQLFVRRLNDNLSKKLKTALPVLAMPKTCQQKERLSLATRWRNARETARQLRARGWQYAPAFIVVALVAFIAPHEAAKAKSWQDCAGMGFNLMFLGSLGAAILAVPAQMAANLPPEATGRAARKAARKLNSQRSGGNWCCWDACDCCDYDDCDCCGCDCLSGCCDACDCGGCGC